MKSKSKAEVYIGQRQNGPKMGQPWELKSLFMDILRHDLLNPAGAAYSIADHAYTKEDDPEKRMALEIILSNLNRVIELVNDCFVLSRAESEDEIEYHRRDISTVIKEARGDMALKIVEKDMTIETMAAGKYPAMLNPLFHEVITNLLSNAIKYSPRSSTIKVDIEKSGEDWRISVADRGYGIPDDEKLDIFNRFQRIEKGAVKGIGLGLAIVKRVVEMHRGSVWIEDNPGGGSIFYVTIPKAQ